MQVIWYPLFGQLYVLANHLRIDRSDPTAAIESLKEVSYFLLILYRILATFLNYDSSLAQAAREVVRKKLSLIIFPEGTRSADGRLLHFKKAIFINLLKCVIFSTFAT
jgi:1-acyl-sn-glycerol-3-phosphate acyltransferase